MEYAHPEALVSTEWLAQHLDDPEMRVIDASHFLPIAGRDGHAEYKKQHIANAVYFDIDDISDSESEIDHMLPDPVKFASKVQKLGIGNGSQIVVYDRVTGGAAARVWWMFRVFGHDKIAILDGGLTKWLSENRPVDDMPPRIRDRHFVPHFRPELVRSMDQVKQNLQTKRELVLDARSPGRFAGTEAEPRAGQRSGHIPRSKNVFWADLVDPKTKIFLPADALAQRFAKEGVAPNKPIIASCGSGVTACTVAFGLYLVGRDDVAVFDGSWSEWSADENAPVATGAA